MMSGSEDNPVRLLAAAWEAANAVVTEWAEQTAALTRDAYRKLVSDPAVRAAWASWRVTVVWARQDCECSCATAHPGDVGVCDNQAVITRRFAAGQGGGEVDVPLCAPCAVAQGVAEMPGNSASG
jgi:hypothetical protein